MQQPLKEKPCSEWKEKNKQGKKEKHHPGYDLAVTRPSRKGGDNHGIIAEKNKEKRPHKKGSETSSSINNAYNQQENADISSIWKQSKEHNRFWLA